MSGARSEPAAVSVRALRASELTPELRAAWASIQESRPEFASPFLRPEFTLAAASVFDRVRVGVIERAGEAVGFLPFERHLMGIGRPVASMVSDCQAVVALPDAAWSIDSLLRGCGLASLEFNHLLVSQEAWKACHRRVSSSPVMCLKGGYEAYKTERRAAGSEQIKKADGLGRKIEREIGPLRFEARSVDPAALEWLVRHKAMQCASKGRTDALGVPAVRRLVDALLRIDEPGFAGMLSTLHAGDRLVAAHLGMRSRTLWHYWFPVYDEELSKYSPGILLLLRMAAAAPEMGIDAIELGKGEASYKQRLMNASVDVCEATAFSASPGAFAARTLLSGRQALRRSPFNAAAKSLWRWWSNR